MGNSEEKARLPQLNGPPGGVTPISRALVHESVYDTYNEDVVQCPDTEGADRDHISLEDDSKQREGTFSLYAAKAWLDLLCEKERAATVWVTEYTPGRLALQRERAKLSSFSTDKNMENDDTRGIQITNMSKVLERIAAGLGPRSPKYEDLIEPLRLKEVDADSQPTEFPSAEETYEELLNVLQAWNQHVGSIPDLVDERKALLDALGERYHLLIDIEVGRRKRTDLQQQSTHLARVLKAFRPEIVEFENQDVFDVLIIMVANVRIAFPDIDDEVKLAMYKALYTEIKLDLLTDKQYNTNDRRIVAERESARNMGGQAQMVKELTKEKLALKRRAEVQRAEKLIDLIRMARKNLRTRRLEELQDLTVLQASQKGAAAEQISIVRSWLDEGDSDAVQNLGEMRVADALCNVDLVNIEQMLKSIRDCLYRIRRFAALDIKSLKEREKMKMSRREDTETALMMMKVDEDSRTMAQIPSVIERHMEDLQSAFEPILEAAQSHYRVLDGCLQMIGEAPEGSPEVFQEYKEDKREHRQNIRE